MVLSYSKVVIPEIIYYWFTYCVLLMSNFTFTLFCMQLCDCFSKGWIPSIPSIKSNNFVVGEYVPSIFLSFFSFFSFVRFLVLHLCLYSPFLSFLSFYLSLGRTTVECRLLVSLILVSIFVFSCIFTLVLFLALRFSS